MLTAIAAPVAAPVATPIAITPIAAPIATTPIATPIATLPTTTVPIVNDIDTILPEDLITLLFGRYTGF